LANHSAELEEDLLPHPSGEFPFMEYTATLLQGKWFIIASVILLSGVMLGYTLLSTPVYEANALVLVDSQRGMQRVPIGDDREVNVVNKVANDLNILKSRVLAGEVAAALLAQPYLDSDRRVLLPITRLVVDGTPRDTLADIENVTTRLQLSTTFTPERESDILRITASSSDPDEAAIVANRFAEIYKGHNLNASRARSKSLREFLESRLGEQGAVLSKAEGSLKGFLQSSGVVSMDAESNRLVHELSELEAMRNALDIDVQTQSQRLASMQSELPKQQANAANVIGDANDPYIHMLQEQLARLEVQRDVITVQNDPAVLGQEMYAQKLSGINKQIEALRGKLKAKTSQMVGSQMPEQVTGGQQDPLSYVRTLQEKILEARLDMSALQSRRAALENIIKDYESKFEKLPAQTLDIARLQRERESAEKLYLMVEEKFNEAAITEKSEFGNVEVVDRATVPSFPVSPNMRVNLTIGVLGGFLLGVGFVIARDKADARVKTPDQLRRKGFISLAEIAPMGKELIQMKGQGADAQDIQRVDEHLWLLFSPFSFLGESYRRLRTNLLRVQRDHRLQVILMTGPNPQEGKTTTLSNLAIVLAETQKRVLLIDADLRRPNVHSLFKLSSAPGLTDVLAERARLDQVIHRNVFDSLDVICSGTESKNPSGVFAGRKFASVLDGLRQSYDWVLIDGPPILVVNDAAVLSSLADGTILTVSADTTRVAALERAKKFLSDAGGHLVGVVLNNFDAQRVYGPYYGGQHYGHYSHETLYYAPTNGKQKLARRA
jgi:capsular exopolysaccharide synthesis family protein